MHITCPQYTPAKSVLLDFNLAFAFLFVLIFKKLIMYSHKGCRRNCPELDPLSKYVIPKDANSNNPVTCAIGDCQRKLTRKKYFKKHLQARCPSGDLGENCQRN